MIWLLLACLLVSEIAAATTYYVGKSGSDANSCTTAQSSTAGNRKLTIAGGTSCASSNNTDVVIVGNGTYVEQLTQSNFVSGTSWANAMTLKCENHLGCVLKPSSSMQNAIDLDGTLTYVIIGASGGGLDIDGSTAPVDGSGGTFPRALIKVWGTCASGYNVHHIRFQYNDIHHKTSTSDNGSTVGTSGDACNPNNQYLEFLYNTLHNNGVSDFSNTFYIQTGNNTFRGNVMHDSKGAGIALSQQNGGYPSDNILDGNRCYAMGLTNTKGDCILLAGTHATRNLIINNIGSGSTDWSCINAEESGPVNNEIYYNTCYGNPLYGINVGGSGNIVKYNIAYNNTTANTRDATGSNTISNNTTADPSFVNVGSRDFHLQSGSVAIGAGADPGGSKVTTDFDAVSRPQGAGWDNGAYEYFVSVSPPGSGGSMGRSSKGLLGIR